MKFCYLNKDNKEIVEAKPTPILNVLKTANMVRLRQVQLRNPRINLTNSLAQVIKAFQNPVFHPRGEMERRVNLFNNLGLWLLLILLWQKDF